MQNNDQCEGWVSVSKILVEGAPHQNTRERRSPGILPPQADAKKSRSAVNQLNDIFTLPCPDSLRRGNWKIPCVVSPHFGNLLQFPSTWQIRLTGYKRENMRGCFTPQMQWESGSLHALSNTDCCRDYLTPGKADQQLLGMFLCSSAGLCDIRTDCIC